MNGTTPPPAAPAVAGVVLAAGAAQRMGGRVKALLERDGVPLVRRAAAALLDAGVRDVVVVTGHRAAEVTHALQGTGVRALHHPGYAAGQVSSLRAGLAATSPAVDAVVVALADQPLLEASDVAALLDAFIRRGPARVIVPRVGGRRGNPVVFDGCVRDAILRGDGGFGARDWMQEHPEQVAWFDSDRPGYVEDVDDPLDLERIAERYGCTLGWPGD